MKGDNWIKPDFTLFPFLELPVELQCIVLEQLSVGATLNIRCVCNYFNTLDIPNKHVTQLPEMGILNTTNVPRLPEIGVFNFVDGTVYNAWSSGKYQCQLTVMATPTVFHFGLIMDEHYKVPEVTRGLITGEYYKAPEVTGVNTFIHEMTDRVGRFAKEGSKFKYDVERLKSFLLHSWQNKHRVYIFQQNIYSGKHVVYVELDASFGIGIEFKKLS